MTRPRQLPSRAHLLAILRYVPETGELFWRVPVGPLAAGMRAGSTAAYGYRRVKIGRRYYAEHRLVFLMVTGESPEMIDHRDGNRSNNAWANLRVANAFENGANQKLRRSNSSGYKGVTFNQRTGKFQAQIRANGTRRYLGSFDVAEAAHRAYCDAANALHKEFANHG